MCRILPCPRTYFHQRIRCRLHSAPTKQFAVLHLHSSFFLLPSPRHGFGRLCSLLLHSSFFLLPSPQCGFARFFCIHHSSFLILHSPQGILDKPWTCPGTIAPPQTPVFEQPSLSRPLSRGISTAERFNLKNACESTQRRKGAKKQGFRRVGTFTRWVSEFKPAFPSPSPCPLRLCLLASLR